MNILPDAAVIYIATDMFLRCRRTHVALLAGATLALILAVFAQSDAVLAQAVPPSPPASARSAAALKQYCGTCHNERLKPAGFVNHPPGLAQLGAGHETEE